MESLHHPRDPASGIQTLLPSLSLPLPGLGHHVWNDAMFFKRLPGSLTEEAVFGALLLILDICSCAWLRRMQILLAGDMQ